MLNPKNIIMKTKNKKLIYTYVFYTFFLSVFTINSIYAHSINEIKNIRAGKHQNFYRIVLETSLKVDTKIELKIVF